MTWKYFKSDEEVSEYIQKNFDIHIDQFAKADIIVKLIKESVNNVYHDTIQVMQRPRDILKRK